MPEHPPTPEERIPHNLGVNDYAKAWDNIASIREHAFELVDESQSEEALGEAGSKLAPYLVRGLAMDLEDTVLEIGCGVARLGKVIAPFVKEWIGLDVSANMIGIADERLVGFDNVRTLVGDGATLAGVDDCSVDKMYCHAVFIHMDKEDLFSYLSDAKRVLKPGGLFYFDLWNLCDPVGWLRWQVERSLYASKVVRPVNRNQFSSPDEVRAMLAMLGWEVLQFVETFYIQPVVTHVSGDADREEALASVRGRFACAYSELRFTPGDYASFSAALIERLRERGHEPEVSMEQIRIAAQRAAAGDH